MTYIKGIPRSIRQKPRPAILHLNMTDELPWGAHKNRTVRWVLDHNPAYIDWIMSNIEPEMNVRFKFTTEVQEELRRIKQSPDYIDEDPHSYYREYYRLRERLVHVRQS